MAFGAVEGLEQVAEESKTCHESKTYFVPNGG